MSKRLMLILLLLILFPLFGCKSTTEMTGMIFAFNTTVEIRIKSKDYKLEELEDIYKEVVYILSDYSKLSDNFKKYDGINNIYTINHKNDYVEVSDKLIDLINESIRLMNETNGYFNPYIGKLSKIYKDIIEYEKLPDNFNELISKEVNNINEGKIEIEGNKVKIIGDIELDLGGVSKGYVLDIIKEYLDSKNIHDYLINAGGSSILLGEKNKNKGYYKIASKYDSNKVFKIKNKVLGTSSIYEQSVTINNKLYHHIINPFTGLVNNNYDCIYIIGNGGAIIDSYTTAFFNMDLEEIKEFIKDKELSIIIYNNNSILYSNSEGDFYG